MPRYTLYERPWKSTTSPGASSVPANRDPILTLELPAANAFTRSPEYLMPPSAITGMPEALATSEASATAVNCGTPTPATMRVVQIEPGPTPIFTHETPALIRASVPIVVRNRGIANLRRDPEMLVVYSTATRDNRAYFSIMSDIPLYAAIYAPRAFVDMLGDATTGTLFGALVGDRVIFRGDFSLHYDEGLRAFSGETPSYALDKWRLLPPHEMVAMVW